MVTKTQIFDDPNLRSRAELIEAALRESLPLIQEMWDHLDRVKAVHPSVMRMFSEAISKLESLSTPSAVGAPVVEGQDEIVPPSKIIQHLLKRNFCYVRDFGRGQKVEEWDHIRTIDQPTFVSALTQAYEEGWHDRARLAPAPIPPAPVDLAEIEELVADLESAWMKIDSSTEEQHLSSTLRIQDRRTALLQAITRMGGKDAWLPIESAPKEWKRDGTGVAILVSLPPIGALKDPDARRVYEARWSEEEKTYTSINGFAVYSAATHWMPMPLPAALSPNTAGGRG